MGCQSDARLVLFPGLGADRRLFEPQQAAFASLEVPDWIRPRRAESLRGYAGRMAEGLDPRPPVYLGGASFGGMVALEVARVLGPKAVFLIGSCRSARAIPRRLRLLQRLSRLSPVNPFSVGRWLLPLVARYFGVLRAEHRRLLAAMASDAPPRFLRWGCAAIMGWSCPCDLAAPVFHIHGGADRIIPLRSVEADRVVGGAGHLLSLTHPDAVNSFIAEGIEATERGAMREGA